MSRSLAWKGTGGLAAAAAVVLLALWLSPRGAGMPPISAALGAARDSLDAADAARIRWYTVSLAGEVSDTVVITSARNLGYRIEDGGRVEVYDAVAHQHYRYIEATGALEVSAMNDPVIIGQMLKGTRLDENIEALQVLSRENDDGVLREQIEIDGRPAFRVTGCDANGDSIIVEFDAETNRLLRTESSLVDETGAGAGRVVVRYEYPEIGELDTGLFGPPADPATAIAGPARPTFDVRQGMINARNLTMMIVMYQSEHEGLLPSSLDQLERYAPPGGLAPVVYWTPGGASQAVRAVYLFEGQDGIPYEMLAPTDRLVEFRFDGGIVAGFADGHSELITGE